MRKVAGLAVAACLLVAGACSNDVEQASTVDRARLRLPQQIAGLRVVREDIKSKLEGIDRPYVDTVAVFSLRDEELLRASLQVNRFNGAANPEDRKFTDSIVSTIGGSSPQKFRVSDKDVFATAASDQVVFTWFHSDGMFVLAIQRDFEFPRTLLRRVLKSELSA
ncbi:MAG: hypothetical protein WD646_03960 [Actinomycetota bacterium]